MVGWVGCIPCNGWLGGLYPVQWLAGWVVSHAMVGWVGCISCNAPAFTRATNIENRLYGGNLLPMILDAPFTMASSCCFSSGAAKPRYDRKSEDAFNGCVVETYHDLLCNAESPELPQEVQALLCLFVMHSVFLSQLRSLEIVAPRNLKDSTCSTSTPFNERGRMGVYFLQKSTIISFVFDTFNLRLLSAHQPTIL